MYRVLDTTKNKLLIVSTDIKSIIKYLIDHMNYNRKIHIILKDEKEMSMGELLRLKMNMESLTGKHISTSSKVYSIQRDKEHDDEVNKLFGSFDDSE